MQGKNFVRISAVFLFFAAAFLPAFTQEVKGIIISSEKHIEIGRPLPVRMEITHPASTIVLFPDSAKGFSPYELKSKKSFETKTENGISLDKADYDILSWEIDSIQKIRLPFFYISGKDTLTDSTNTLSFLFSERISVLPDSINVRSNPGIVSIKPAFNWRAFLIIGSGILIILIGGIYFLRKPLRNWMRRMRLEKEWRKVLERLKEAENKIHEKKIFSVELNKIWKEYFSGTENELVAFSTSELKRALNEISRLDENEKNALFETSRFADLILYAGMDMEPSEATRLLSSVRGIMEKENDRRKKEVGK